MTSHTGISNGGMIYRGTDPTSGHMTHIASRRRRNMDRTHTGGHQTVLAGCAGARYFIVIDQWIHW